MINLDLSKKEMLKNNQLKANLNPKDDQAVKKENDNEEKKEPISNELGKRKRSDDL